MASGAPRQYRTAEICATRPMFVYKRTQQRPRDIVSKGKIKTYLSADCQIQGGLILYDRQA
jgi:hypothetical protein